MPKKASATRKKASPKVEASKAKPTKTVKSAKAVSTLLEQTAAQLIDQRIEMLGGWRGESLARMRELILEADASITEEWKWSNPVWSHNGIICTGEAYKKAVKLTFAHGASLPDPKGLFNSSLEGNTRRAIDIGEGDKVDAKAFKALINAGVARNASSSKAKPTAKEKPAAKEKDVKEKSTEKSKLMGSMTLAKDRNGKEVVLLSGGNPQIAKADGDAPVQAYIDAMQGWKCELGQRLDEIIAQVVPRVRKAVRWNSPFYRSEAQGWFVSFHVFAKYVKVTFFDGKSLKPIPPGGTPTSKEARWIDIYEGDKLDEDQFASWIKQAAALPGWDTK